MKMKSIISPPKKEKTYTLKELREIAKQDETVNENHHWNNVNNCCTCGGTGAFLDWLESH